jgi:hypothetical protein
MMAMRPNASPYSGAKGSYNVCLANLQKGLNFYGEREENERRRRKEGREEGEWGGRREGGKRKDRKVPLWL